MQARGFLCHTRYPQPALLVHDTNAVAQPSVVPSALYHTVQSHLSMRSQYAARVVILYIQGAYSGAARSGGWQ